MAYEPVSNKPSFPEIEKNILAFWNERNTFQKSLEWRKGGPEFVFYDGPPFATGLPHYGHLLAGTIKDIVPRYQTMRGYYVDRRFGWDCHGLPVEYEVEQNLEISGKTDIEKLGVDVFNEACRGIVLRYTAEWRNVVTRMGRWVDFDRDYKTMDPSYMESIWWVFKTLWDKGLIYEGHKILPYCPRCATPLSNFETNQGYQEVQDPAITVRFRLLDEDNAYILAWTTTPWTLPSNLALAVGPEIAYARVKDGDDVYYLAKDRLGAYYKDPSNLDWTECRGRDLAGRRYEPLFPYFAQLAEHGAFRILEADFVSTEDGTGVVHIAPGFGEDDNRLGRENGLPALCPVDAEGRFTDAVPDYAGRPVKETDPDIINRLKQEGKLVHRGTIRHSYPHCWRCDTPLIYRAISTWFVRVEQIKQRMLSINQTIHWVPDHLRDGRFGKWLEGARDWAISRNRYWGAPLPIWRSEDGEEIVCIGSIAELEKRSGRKIQDLHKHHVDAVTIPSERGKGVLRRIPEVLDCWFESGSMPYAQAHYPFENKEHFEAHFPADFIAEGLDQTRGWFYTLVVLATALFDRAPFRHVIVNGLVRAEDGRKMSKRLKNYPDPMDMIETYGADALRLYLVNSPVVRAEDLCFSEAGIRHLMRDILIPLWNAYSFFVTYANIDGWNGTLRTGSPSKNVLDRWIRSSLETLIEKVRTAMDAYDLQRSVRPFVAFIEDLTNWYIRRSRRRFWKSRDDADKRQAYETLYTVLLQLSKVAAPFIPFISEAIYQNLRTDDMPESVHLCDFPEVDASNRDPDLEHRMNVVMTVVRLGRQLRTDHSLKVRQPLQSIHVVSRDETALASVTDLADIIRDELNVKNVLTGRHETDLADIRAKADFRKLGPRFGKKVKTIAAALAALEPAVAARLAAGDPITLPLDNGESVTITPDDVVLERTPKAGLVVAAEGALVVALETDLTDELILEGLAREFVNKVQNMRKNADYDVTQRITVRFHGDETTRRAVETHRRYIMGETLAVDLAYADASPQQATTWNLNGHETAVTIEPAADTPGK